MGDNTSHNWTDERLAQFRDLYAQGLSHSQIGARMGITKNGSVSKAQRLGLEARGRGFGSPWTDELMGRLCRLYAQGHSHSMIAAALGMSKNAVLGKATRLGLEGRRGLHKPAAAAGKPRKRKLYLRAPQGRPTATRRDRLAQLVAERVEADAPPLAPGTPVTLLELRDHHCRFPVPCDDQPMMYCGASKTHDSSYCNAHHRLTHEGY